MKIKTKTKKILVLGVMVALLVTTGVLNFVLNDKITSVNKDGSSTTVNNNVTATFFESCRTDRTAQREADIMLLDTIINSANTSPQARIEAENKKLSLIEQGKIEKDVETLIKGKGFQDALIAINQNGIKVVVDASKLTVEEANIIKDIVVDCANCKAGDIKIVPYV